MSRGFLKLNPGSELTTKRLVMDGQDNMFWEEIVRTPVIPSEEKAILVAQQKAIDLSMADLVTQKATLAAAVVTLDTMLNS